MRHPTSVLMLIILAAIIPHINLSIAEAAPKGANKNPLVKQGPAKPQPQAPAENTSTVIEYDDTTPEDTGAAGGRPIERLFKNPIFASGISSGADAINQSLETLMESLFYNLMDNKLKWPLTDSSNVTLGFTRDVFSARSGAYVVVDRFGLGPEYSRELYRFNDIPVNLGVNQSTDVYDIYLRSDPMRILDNKNLPWWRVVVNNWFGALPLLESVLPPSFNANELYDPLKRLETPFTFPLSIPAVEAMDAGTIKSYAVSGGINLGVEIVNGIHGIKDQMMTGPTALDMKLPYTVFRTGEYRINVLKRDAKTVWVGLADTSRLGHRVETKLGKTYYLLSKTIPLWRGMPAHVFPFDFTYEEGVSDIFSRVYSFDLRNDEARTAYIEAVHGNFAAAQISALRAKEDGFDTGVSFFHDKKEKRFDRGFGTGHSAFIINKKTKRVHSDAEIEITDNSGRFHVLEAKEDHDVARWNMLTGRSEQNITLQAELKVRKVIEQQGDDQQLKSRFEFVAEDNTVDIGFSLAINDKFVETEELADYLKDLSRFTKLEIHGLPKFSTREPDLLANRRKRAVFQTDASRDHLLHVTPTHLGRFEGYASVRMTHAQLTSVAALPRQVLWLALCNAFKVAAEEKCLSWEKSIWLRNLYRTGGFILQPLRLLDFRWLAADAVNEIEDAVAALKDFEKSNSPEEKQAALRRLFATEYPIERVEALLSVSDLKNIPRLIELETQPKGNAPEEVRKKFAQINGHRFRGEKPFPPPARYDSTKDTESKFDPANLTFSGLKPRVKKISLYKEPVAKSSKLRDAQPKLPILVTKVSVSRVPSSQSIRVYVRLEQAGRVQLAKLKLIEDVVEIPVPEDVAVSSPDRSNFIVKLSGPQSVLANVISEEAIASGGEFKLTLAVSGNSLVWSDEKHLEFRLEDGKLLAR